MNTIRIAVIRFQNEIKHKDIRQFRGAIINSIGRDNILFHNHNNNGYLYSYPLVQYRIIGNNPCIVCLNNAINSIVPLITSESLHVNIGNQSTELTIKSIEIRNFDINFSNTPVTYTIRHWLPLNEYNYTEFQQIPKMADKVPFLENILVGNILSCLKGLGIYVNSKISCSITDLSSPRFMPYKSTQLLSFDATFQSNIQLPEMIGIGKSASTYFGTLIMANK